MKKVKQIVKQNSRAGDSLHNILQSEAKLASLERFERSTRCLEGKSSNSRDFQTF
jgi:hypothetical protein